MRKRATYNLNTLKDRICNDTECDHNDFGKCVHENPDIDKSRLAYVGVWIHCYTRSRKQMTRAEYEEGVFL
jgi:hypothetical protein